MSQQNITKTKSPIELRLSNKEPLMDIQFGDETISDPISNFAESVNIGLENSPRILQSQYLYDSKGSKLFEQICDLPEYYLSRTEEQILSQHSNEISSITGSVTLIELGAGTSRKTKFLLDNYNKKQTCLDYVAIDVSQSALDFGMSQLSGNYKYIEFHTLCTTWERAFPLFSGFGKNMVIFLGSSIGNLSQTEFADFFTHAAQSLKQGDFFLLGVDLHKDTSTLEAAYNDSAGVTAQFTKNLFVRMNSELGSNIDISKVKHRARYNTLKQQIEIYAEFLADQEIHIAPLGVTHLINKGDIIHTEISRKFEQDSIVSKLAFCGFKTKKVFNDIEKQYALLLLERS